MILLLVGNIGSGKSTAANILKEKFGFVEYSFASPLKDFALSIGFNFEDVYGSQDDKKRINPFFGISGRQFMQRFGTEVMRDHSSFIFDNKVENVWTKAMEIKLSRALSFGHNIVVSDGRFKDEAQLIKNLGGTVIRLHRKCIDSSPSDHSSERELDNIPVDKEFCNDGSIDDLISFLSNCVMRFTDESSKSEEKV